MQELNFSVFIHQGQNSGAEQQSMLLKALFDTFERQHHIHVNFEIIDWHVGWARLVEMSIYGRGPDVSEVGSTWMGDLVRMHALRSFSPLDVKQIGSKDNFVEAVWKAGITPSSIDSPISVWGIPWLADMRVIAYRRDYFKKANIDPNQAFKNIETFADTVATLKAHGFEVPILFTTTTRSHLNVHQMVSWIWACGGDFMSPDGKKVAFDSPQALQGMKHYFELGKSIPKQYQKISEAQIEPPFVAGKTAILFSGSWLLDSANLNVIHTNLGLAPMTGGSFTGGSHLVVWKHSPRQEAATLLIDFLIKHSAEYKLFPSFGLPAYLPDWTLENKFLEEPYFNIFREALQNGHSLPESELWAMVEKRLADIIPHIWEKIFASDDPDIDKILSETIVPLARIINLSLDH